MAVAEFEVLKNAADEAVKNSAFSLFLINNLMLKMKKNNSFLAFGPLANLFSLVFIFLVLFTACTPKQQDETPKSNPLIADGLGIARATLIVKNLDSARSYYTDVLGFSMPIPKKYEKGIYDSTQMASINFEDFASFDLLSTTDSVLKAGKQASVIKQHKNASLYSFSTSSVDTTTKWLHAQGFKTKLHVGRSTKEIAKGWDWDDGGPQWRSVEFESKDAQTHLPSFLEYVGLPYKAIQDEWKPAAWRQYYEKNANGVVSLALLRIVVANLKTATDGLI
jgi:hypothetical protein